MSVLPHEPLWDGQGSLYINKVLLSLGDFPPRHFRNSISLLAVKKYVSREQRTQYCCKRICES